MTDQRSNRADVRNPMLRDPRIISAWEQLRRDHPAAAAALRDFLKFITETARFEGDKLWDKNKYRSASYWKEKAVDARHLRLAAKAEPAVKDAEAGKPLTDRERQVLAEGAHELEQLQLALHGGALDRHRLTLCTAVALMRAFAGVDPNPLAHLKAARAQMRLSGGVADERWVDSCEEAASLLDGSQEMPEAVRRALAGLRDALADQRALNEACPASNPSMKDRRLATT